MTQMIIHMTKLEVEIHHQLYNNAATLQRKFPV